MLVRIHSNTLENPSNLPSRSNPSCWPHKRSRACLIFFIATPRSWIPIAITALTRCWPHSNRSLLVLKRPGHAEIRVYNPPDPGLERTPDVCVAIPSVHLEPRYSAMLWDLTGFLARLRLDIDQKKSSNSCVSLPSENVAIS
jgi:hypothetical protein